MITEIQRVKTLKEASDLVKETSGMLYLAGGTAVNHGGSTEERSAVLIGDLLERTIDTEGDALRIAAGVTLQQLIDSPLVPEVLGQAASFIYFRNVRNMATIAGNIASGWSVSTMLPALCVLGARVQTVEGQDLSVTEYLSSCPQELITHIVIPDPSLGCATRKESLSAGSSNLVVAAVSKDTGGSYRCFVSGTRERLSGLDGLEGQLATLSRPSAIEKVRELCEDQLSFSSQPGASEQYLTYCASQLIVDCLLKTERSSI